MTVGIVIGAIALLLVIAFILTFNGMVRERNHCTNTWSQIEVQLKRRHDLIPNLVETVKGYAAHERATFELVTQARANAISAAHDSSVQHQAMAEDVLTGALKQLFAVAEAYPQLKANQSFLNLQGEISSTENRIAAARQRYNDSVLGYNTRIQTFPRNVIARPLHFTAMDFFGAEPAATTPSTVQF